MIMPFAHICENALVIRSIIAENAVIGAGAQIGEETGEIALIGHSLLIKEGTTVRSGVQLGN